MPLIKVASVNDMNDGEARVVNVNGLELALYKINGEFFATSNICLHQGGPLGEGFLEGDTITCPWHGWKYNVKTGISPVMPTAKVKTYNVVVQGEDVMVELP